VTHQDQLRYLLLAPSASSGAGGLRPTREDSHLYNAYLRTAQKFRGDIYLKDGAIQQWQLDPDGRYRMPGDEDSWHLLLVLARQKVVGCTRFLMHPNTVSFDRLTFRNAPLAKDRSWGAKVRYAFETELRVARAEGMSYVELGGWAIAEEWRNTRAALKILLAAYAWAGLMGGCLCACTATVRHGSSSILRKIGGGTLEYRGEQLPAYSDPAYGCQMELLRFDSRYPNPKFSPLVREVQSQLADSLVLTGGKYADPSSPRESVPGSIGLSNGGSDSHAW